MTDDFGRSARLLPIGAAICDYPENIERITRAMPDGELIGQLPYTISTVPDALPLLVPPNADSGD